MKKSIRTILMEKHAELFTLAGQTKNNTMREHHLAEANGVILAIAALRDAGINVDFALLEEESAII